MVEVTQAGTMVTQMEVHLDGLGWTRITWDTPVTKDHADAAILAAISPGEGRDHALAAHRQQTVEQIVTWMRSESKYQWHWSEIAHSIASGAPFGGSDHER